MMGGRPPRPDTVAGINVTAAIFLLLAALGVVGGLLASGRLEPGYKVGLFILGALGTASSFLGTRKFHLRRVAATGDPRTTVYSALTIYSMLFFAVLFVSLALVIFGREFGLLTEEFSSFVAYFFITDVVALLFMLGMACLYDMVRPGLLARRIYLWPWEYMLRTIRDGRPEPSDSDATRNDADRNEDHHDPETHGKDS